MNDVKMLVFAHVPPPHHGQSYMVSLLLAGLGSDQRKSGLKLQSPNPNTTTGQPCAPAAKTSAFHELITSTTSLYGVHCYHVDARFARELSDSGRFHFSKAFHLLSYCAEAVWCKFRYDLKVLYYVPAPAEMVSLYRDWIVMLLCRPFFPRIIFHWHAVGLGEFLERDARPLVRWLSHRLLDKPHLSIVLGDSNRNDASRFRPRNIRVVRNGIPDPCPDFQTSVWPRRSASLARAQGLLAPGSAPKRPTAPGLPRIHWFKVLYLALCTREKGLFDTLEAIALINQELIADQTGLRVHLTVAGSFVREEESAEFNRRLASADFQLLDLNVRAELPAAAPPLPANLPCLVDYKGFVGGEVKRRLLQECDCLCFPTYYAHEAQPVNLLEAMAFGMSIATTRWRSIPEMFPVGYAGLVDVRTPKQIVAALRTIILNPPASELRANFLERFEIGRFLDDLAKAIHSVAS